MILLVAICSEGFYVPGVAPVEFAKDQLVEVKVCPAIKYLKQK